MYLIDCRPGYVSPRWVEKPGDCSLTPMVGVHDRRYLRGGELETRSFVPILIQENSSYFIPRGSRSEGEGFGYASN